MAKKGVEAYARTKGQGTITPELIKQAKEKMMGNRHGGPAIAQGELDRKTSVLTPEDQRRFFAREGVNPLRHAFDRKSAVHAGAGGDPLPAEEALPTWQALSNKPDKSTKRTAYIHIPFCEGRCRFCGFYMNPFRKDESVRYIDALLEEIKLTSERPAVTSHPIHAVYLGGGTPTALEPDDLKRLLKGIVCMLPLSNDCEITVEGRVHNFGLEKMEACIEGGANRFSIGVQTFNTKIRQQMGRIEERINVLEMLQNLCALDQGAVIIDLIYGFPEQTMEIWKEDLRTRTTGERNRYNSYTRYGALCIPLGSGAGGRLHGHYFFQEGDLKTYYQRVKAGEKPVATAIRLPDDTSLFRNLVGQLEEGAVNFARLGKEHNIDLEKIFSPILEQWEKTGLVRLPGDGWMELTIAGEFWNVNLAQALIDYFLLAKKEKGCPGTMVL
jgi:coproporphyrinogen III oxidase-like Fe-S oxidoreductase